MRSWDHLGFDLFLVATDLTSLLLSEDSRHRATRGEIDSIQRQLQSILNSIEHEIASQTHVRAAGFEIRDGHLGTGVQAAQ